MTYRGCFRRKLMLAAASVAVALAHTHSGHAQTATAASADTARMTFNIPAQPLSSALTAYSRQARLAIAAPPALVSGKRNTPINGEYTPQEALDGLLQGTGLKSSRGANGGLTLIVDTPRAISTEAPQLPPTERVEAAISEIFVVGQRSLNTGIRRTEDDMQPYVVLGEEDLQKAQAVNIEDFLRIKVPMNTQGAAAAQTASSSLGVPRIDMRGLGSGQTLLLVDGRRLPTTPLLNEQIQPDVLSIPTAVVERVEVLPSSASGIFGGGAVGGVINIVTRKDFEGAEVTATYGITSRGDAPYYRVDGTYGGDIADGAVHLQVAASYAKAKGLLAKNRDFLQNARALALQNDPALFFVSNGFPVVGRLTNIRSTTGENLVLDSGTPLNSAFTYVPEGYAGPAGDGGAALVANAGHQNIELPNSSYFGSSLGSLIPDRETGYGAVTLQTDFNDRLQGFLDVSYRSNARMKDYYNILSNIFSVTIPADAPNNPFRQSINVAFPLSGLTEESTVKAFGINAVAGLIYKFAADWSASADYSWGRANVDPYGYSSTKLGDPDGAGPGLAFRTATSNGTLDVMRDLDAYPLNYTPYLYPYPDSRSGAQWTDLNNFALRTSGPLFDLPGGPVTVTASAEYRDESTSPVAMERLDTIPGSVTYYPERAQRQMAGYLETRMPLVSGANRIPMVDALELQMALRYDAYKIHMHSPATVRLANVSAPIPALTEINKDLNSFSYTAGVRYEPLPDIALRASYATGFLPPSFSQLLPGVPVPLTSDLVDPQRGNARTAVSYMAGGGGNLDLGPEKSKSLSLGAIVTPRFLDGMRLSVDYTRIDKTDEVRAPGAQEILNREDIFPGRVIRAPLTPQDQALGYTGGVIQEIRTISANVQSARLEAFDFQADYRLETERWGDFHAYGVATWATGLERRLSPASPLVDYVGYSNGPLEWRANYGLGWRMDGFSIDWNAQYFSSRRIYASTASDAQIQTAVRLQGNATLPGQTYHDLTLTYRFDGYEAPWGLAGSTFQFGVENIFDTAPSVLATTSTLPQFWYNTNGDVRLRRFTFRFTKRI